MGLKLTEKRLMFAIRCFTGMVGVRTPERKMGMRVGMGLVSGDNNCAAVPHYHETGYKTRATVKKNGD